MKYSFLIFCTLSTITPSLNHAKLWNTASPKKVVTISPKDRIIHLELDAEQNGKKAKGGFTVFVIGALAAAGRLCQKNGKIEKLSLAAVVLTMASGGYGAWCTWSEYSLNQEAEDLKEEHNITVRYAGDEEYLEETAKAKRRNSI